MLCAVTLVFDDVAACWDEKWTKAKL